MVQTEEQWMHTKRAERPEAKAARSRWAPENGQHTVQAHAG
jgi:hypothetical protein